MLFTLSEYPCDSNWLSCNWSFHYVLQNWHYHFILYQTIIICFWCNNNSSLTDIDIYIYQQSYQHNDRGWLHGSIVIIKNSIANSNNLHEITTQQWHNHIPILTPTGCHTWILIYNRYYHQIIKQTALANHDRMCKSIGCSNTGKKLRPWHGACHTQRRRHPIFSKVQCHKRAWRYRQPVSCKLTDSGCLLEVCCNYQNTCLQFRRCAG